MKKNVAIYLGITICLVLLVAMALTGKVNGEKLYIQTPFKEDFVMNSCLLRGYQLYKIGFKEDFAKKAVECVPMQIGYID